MFQSICIRAFSDLWPYDALIFMSFFYYLRYRNYWRAQKIETFRKVNFLRVIREFQKRKRRFGE
ncbi:MAG: hypothetical protein AYK18_01270 [Theionarchaea archaeon DG-70]|nr:MAG: hypothetical protein AYK18_01270 [Theionarchaea archaeon DG-70]